MQLEAGLGVSKKDDDRARAAPRRHASGWSYERWVKFIALGSFGLWMGFVLFYWRGSSTPGTRSAGAAAKAALATDFKPPPSIHDGFPEETNFIAMGDFGTGDESQRKVAQTLEAFAASLQPPPAFVLSTGDQIYAHGILSADDPLLQSNFEQMYSHPKLQVPWYITIGNHDCEGSIPAMLQYAEKPQSLWYMPQRYYTIDRPVAPKTIMRLVVLDACDLVCGHEPQDERCNGNMNEQSSGVTRKEQYQWIEEVLRAPKPAGVETMWTLVMGHWGVYSYAGNADTPELINVLDPLLKKHHVHAYFNGHDHCMQHIQKKENGWTRNYFISGAGGYKIHELQPGARANADLVHAAMTHGFMSVHMTQHRFQVQFLDDTGEVLYTTEVLHEDAE